MYNYSLQLELRLRNENMAAQMEQDRWERLSATTLPRAKRDWDIRRMARGLADTVAGLRCQLQTRFAIEQSSLAC